MKQINNKNIYVIKLTENSWLGDNDMEYVEVTNLSAAERYIGYSVAKDAHKNVSSLLSGDYDDIKLQKIGIDVVELSIFGLNTQDLQDMMFRELWYYDVFSKRKESMPDKWLDFCNQVKSQLDNND